MDGKKLLVWGVLAMLWTLPLGWAHEASGTGSNGQGYGMMGYGWPGTEANPSSDGYGSMSRMHNAMHGTSYTAARFQALVDKDMARMHDLFLGPADGYGFAGRNGKTGCQS